MILVYIFFLIFIFKPCYGLKYEDYFNEETSILTFCKFEKMLKNELIEYDALINTLSSDIPTKLHILHFSTKEMPYYYDKDNYHAENRIRTCNKDNDITDGYFNEKSFNLMEQYTYSMNERKVNYNIHLNFTIDDNNDNKYHSIYTIMCAYGYNRDFNIDVKYEFIHLNSLYLEFDDYLLLKYQFIISIVYIIVFIYLTYKKYLIYKIFKLRIILRLLKQLIFCIIFYKSNVYGYPLYKQYKLFILLLFTSNIIKVVDIIIMLLLSYGFGIYHFSIQFKIKIKIFIFIIIYFIISMSIDAHLFHYIAKYMKYEYYLLFIIILLETIIIIWCLINIYKTKRIILRKKRGHIFLKKINKIILLLITSIPFCIVVKLINKLIENGIIRYNNYAVPSIVTEMIMLIFFIKLILIFNTKQPLLSKIHSYNE